MHGTRNTPLHQKKLDCLSLSVGRILGLWNNLQKNEFHSAAPLAPGGSSRNFTARQTGIAAGQCCHLHGKFPFTGKFTPAMKTGQKLRQQ